MGEAISVRDGDMRCLCRILLMNFDLLVRRAFIVNAPWLGDDDESAYVRIDDSAGDLRRNCATLYGSVGRRRFNRELPGHASRPRSIPHLHALLDRWIKSSLTNDGSDFVRPIFV